MKKLLVLMLALALVAGVAAPALADQTTTTVSIDVTVQTGGGNPPQIKAKWETPDEDPVAPGTQVLPPCVFQGTKTVTYWAVVTDEEDNGNVAQVYVDVYHPLVVPFCGAANFKYEVPMQRVDKFSVGIPAFQDAYLDNLVTFNPNFDYAEVLFELEKCTAEVWMGQADLSYHQPAGDYTVLAYAIDQNGNLSAPLSNTFDYIGVNCIEIDFTRVSYGSAALCTEKWVPGDTSFGTADKPTVRNIGNTSLNIWVKSNDMGFGQDATGQWNVAFDARLGTDPANAVFYDPFVDVMLPNILPPCNTEELDFSIHVKKGVSGEQYEGEMELWSSIATFTPCPP